MQIYHEAPLTLFHKVQEVTDGDYALVHLLEREPAYRDTFMKVAQEPSRKRPLILDNSAYELGKSFHAGVFASWVSKLLPDIYIVPDAPGKSGDTLDAFSDWLKVCSMIPGKRMGVVQGRNPGEAVNCFKDLRRMGADIIGIPFLIGRSFVFNGRNPSLHELMTSRISLVERIHEECEPHPIHLLGVALPQEGKYYARRLCWVESVDSSNPVVHGMFDTRYNHNGIDEKRSELLADLIHREVTPEQEEIIFANITDFRRLWTEV